VFRARSVCWFWLLLAVGCRAVPEDSSPDQETVTGETITITRSSGSSTPGTLRTQAEWEFRPTGECRYSSTSEPVAVNGPGFKSESHWLSQADYKRCRDLVRRTRFSSMQDQNETPMPGGNHTFVSVGCGAEQHGLSFRTGKPPRGIKSLLTFLDECEKTSGKR
jgi:hypothetical protein